ncbi:MAG: hypothetical protein GY749_20045 [Desulfobacteraceae bacterium]|nr:hypothetical protein [Desulfobacteraceae bacterium]
MLQSLAINSIKTTYYKINKIRWNQGFFPISFFYLGMLTKKDAFHMKLPNLNMRKIFVEYFNEVHRIDVSTQYAEIMQGFSEDMNLPALFAGYWDKYVSQLPEAVFQQVNKNFYRTTFYELCSRYLSKWFSWNVERSYPEGRTDLEWVQSFLDDGTNYVKFLKYSDCCIKFYDFLYTDSVHKISNNP